MFALKYLLYEVLCGVLQGYTQGHIILSTSVYIYVHAPTHQDHSGETAMKTAMKTVWLRRGNVGLCRGIKERGDGLVGNIGMWAGGNKGDTPPESSHLGG